MHLWGKGRINVILCLLYEAYVKELPGLGTVRVASHLQPQQPQHPQQHPAMRGSNLLRKAVPPSHPLGYGSYNWLRIARQDLGIVIERAALEDLGTKVRQNDHLSSRPRWLADCKARLGKCIAFGIPLQLPEARERASLSEYPLCSPQTLLRSLARSLGPKWRTPVGGREGYHTVDHTHLRTRQGFSNTRVHWGDLDSMVTRPMPLSSPIVHIKTTDHRWVIGPCQQRDLHSLGREFSNRMGTQVCSRPCRSRPQQAMERVVDSKGPGIDSQKYQDGL